MKMNYRKSLFITLLSVSVLGTATHANVFAEQQSEKANVTQSTKEQAEKTATPAQQPAKVVKQNVTKFGLSTEDTFYYVYGLLHSKAYRENYASDLKKELPRIPEVKDKEKYVEIGKKLADLHLNYEDVPGSVSIKWTHFLRVFLQPIHSRVVS